MSLYPPVHSDRRTSLRLYLPLDCLRRLRTWLCRLLHPHPHLEYRSTSSTLWIPQQEMTGDLTAGDTEELPPVLPVLDHKSLHLDTLLWPWT